MLITATKVTKKNRANKFSTKYMLGRNVSKNKDYY